MFMACFVQRCHKQTGGRSRGRLWSVVHFGLLPEQRKAYPRRLVNINLPHLEGLEERHRGIALEVAVLVVEALPHAGRRYAFALRQRPCLEHGRIEHGHKRCLQASLQSDAFACLQRINERRCTRVAHSSLALFKKQPTYRK